MKKEDHLQFIRNFCIIAHIDHGKSTLADRLLELTETVSKREMKDQILDQMDLERERGITIKLQPVKMSYKLPVNELGENNSSINNSYTLNLVDTPGHVDFTYEVSRSLAACEGVLLLVDATQGIQAQTLANLYMAVDHGLKIIPVINKIDLPNAEVNKTDSEVAEILGCKEDDILKVSAKLGTGVDKVLSAIIERIPPPESSGEDFKALIFDSYYDEYKGVVACVRVFDGEVKKGDRTKFVSSCGEIEVLDLGIFKPQAQSNDTLRSGEVGYVVTGLKDVSECRVGDTLASLEVTKPLPGYEEIKPTVFASFYSTDTSDYSKLREGLEKLRLSDASLYFEPESSTALGRGFRCGFLGLLHLEIIQERLKREFDLDLIITVPSVSYRVALKKGKEITIYSPSELPDPNNILEIKEPWTSVDLIMPKDYIGRVMELMQNYRGVYKTTEYLSSGGEKSRVILHYEAPLSSLIADFYNKLKSVSSGYASMNYNIIGFRAADLVRLDILVAGDLVKALSRIVPANQAYKEGKFVVKKLKDIIPKQNFQVTLQATIGGKILARENIAALRKDVTAKLYGGDVTRKRKLLEKQKKGKKKMKELGKVEIPQEAFLAILKK
jgi:GTP-binding protein LepA